MIEVLVAHRQLPADAIRVGIRAALDVGALDVGALDADVVIVIVEACRDFGDRDPVVVPIDVLARYDRPNPTIAHHDQLLKEAR